MPVITPVDLEPILFRDLGNNNEPWVVAQIARAQEAVEGELGRNIEVEPGIVETIDGSRTRSIFLSRWPVTAITSITEDGTTLTVNTDYRLFSETGMIHRYAAGYPSRWIWKPASIVVTYDAGFPTTHVGYKRLAGVVLAVATRMFEAAASDASKPEGTDALASESIGTYQATYRKDPAPLGETESVSNAMALTDTERAIIAEYRGPLLA